MAQPNFYSDGSTPRRTDTRLIIWRKILGAIQNNLGGAAVAANDPRFNEGLRQTKEKVLRALQ